MQRNQNVSRYQITYSCGHANAVRIGGPNAHGERDAKAAYVAGLECCDCHFAGLKQETRNELRMAVDALAARFAEGG